MTPLLESSLPGIPLRGRGKVRDIYEVGSDLLIVASDRISAFDYVLSPGIPRKGEVLNKISLFWFDFLRETISNHVITRRCGDGIRPSCSPYRDQLAGRSVLVRRADMVQVECVARGYLSGSGWKEYQATGAVCGIALPSGLRESDRLPEPIFTPATKADSGHDENIPFARVVDAVGSEIAAQAAGSDARHLRAGGEVRGDSRDHRRGYEVRVRLRRRRTDPGGRGADAGFVALLAAGPVSARRGSAFVRQAVRPRLPRIHSVEQAAARARIA